MTETQKEIQDADRPPHGVTVKRLVMPEPEWIVNDMGELGVKLGERLFFLYKGDNIEYETGLHEDGTPVMYRMVGKREFGETQWPQKWVVDGRRQDRYTEELLFTPGLSFGKPEDGKWKEFPKA